MKNIDRQKVYTIDDYSFKNFVNMSSWEKEMVLSWRNDSMVSKWMRNREQVSLDTHLRFIDSLNLRTDAYYWLVIKNKIPLGVFDIVDVDVVNNECEPGYYLNPQYMDSGIGLQFNYYCRSFVYTVLEFSSVKGHILVGNTSAYLMSRFFGVREISKVISDGNLYLTMRGYKENFVKVSKELLLREFVKYVKLNRVNWNEIIKNIDNA